VPLPSEEVFKTGSEAAVSPIIVVFSPLFDPGTTQTSRSFQATSKHSSFILIVARNLIPCARCANSI
jgi:hypothetical protein